MAGEKLVRKIILDFIVLVCLGVSLLAFFIWGEPYQRGYFEDDLSIRLPYKNQTISEAVLAIVGFIFIIVTITSVEFVRNRGGRGIGEKVLLGSLMPGWVWEAYIGIGVYIFGAACQQLICTIAKNVIGRLRPHFYAVCQPVPLNSSLNELGYIQEYSCLGTNTELIKESRLSFPSAHTSFATYTAVFFVMYMQNKAKWRGSKLLRHLVQYAAIIAAWYVGLSRIVDNMHHWSDVAVGYAIGSVTAILVFIYVLKPKKYGLPSSWTDQSNTALPR